MRFRISDRVADRLIRRFRSIVPGTPSDPPVNGGKLSLPQWDGHLARHGEAGGAGVGPLIPCRTFPSPFLTYRHFKRQEATLQGCPFSQSAGTGLIPSLPSFQSHLRSRSSGHIDAREQFLRFHTVYVQAHVFWGESESKSHQLSQVERRDLLLILGLAGKNDLPHVKLLET